MWIGFSPDAVHGKQCLTLPLPSLALLAAHPRGKAPPGIRPDLIPGLATWSNEDRQSLYPTTLLAAMHTTQ